MLNTLFYFSYLESVCKCSVVIGDCKLTVAGSSIRAHLHSVRAVAGVHLFRRGTEKAEILTPAIALGARIDCCIQRVCTGKTRPLQIYSNMNVVLFILYTNQVVAFPQTLHVLPWGHL